MAQFLWYGCTFKKQCTVPVTLTFDLWRSIENNPISILYQFKIDISSSSPSDVCKNCSVVNKISYQNIGRTHRQTDTHTDRQTHTHRQTGWKQYLATTSGGEAMMKIGVLLWTYYLFLATHVIDVNIVGNYICGFAMIHTQPYNLIQTASNVIDDTLRQRRVHNIAVRYQIYGIS